MVNKVSFADKVKSYKIEHFYPVYNNGLFYYLMRDPQFAKFVLNGILEVDPTYFEGMELVDSKVVKGPGLKISELDVLYLTKDGTYIHIEIQAYHDPEIVDRFNNYTLSVSFKSKIEKGAKYSTYKKPVTIICLDYDVYDGPGYLWKISNNVEMIKEVKHYKRKPGPKPKPKTGFGLSSDVLLLEYNKSSRGVDDGSVLYKVSRVLAIKSEEDCIMVVKAYPELEGIVEKVLEIQVTDDYLLGQSIQDIMAVNDVHRYERIRKESKAEGLTEGMKKGEKKAEKRMTKNLIKSGVESMVIAQITGLAIDKVEGLRRQYA